MNVVVNILVIILVFGSIIMIHELGHFLMCKWTGIAVTEFSIGMGPCIFKTKRHETQYSIRCLPIGGYCMMLGEDEEECTDERAFSNKPVWSRIAVILGGPVFNFLLAFLASMVLIGMAGYLTGEINYVGEGSGAEEAGLLEGDVITRLNNSRIYDFREVLIFMQFYSSEEPVSVTFQRNGTEQTILVTPKYNETAGMYQLGLSGGYHPENDMYVRTKANLVTNIKYSALELRYWLKTTFVSLKYLITGKIGVNQVSGVVGVADMMNETMEEAKAEGGLFSVVLNVINFLILISVNVGVMNLIPFPALDGGRLLFLLVELITRKPIPKEKEAFVHAIGFVLVFIVMILVTFKDIRNLFV
ncbi:MAG: site-2 protease family protein [Bacteroides sp.]|nr:site-2 protease family protein [Bacteroides sp.]MCM1550481.1 site-2 protease family protein [Clostridium sp.]